jgi:hypothetical protein
MPKTTIYCVVLITTNTIYCVDETPIVSTNIAKAADFCTNVAKIRRFFVLFLVKTAHC